MHGLNWYDYSARYYDPAFPVFTSIDPLAEKYYSWSPYVCCLNNPVNWIDQDGRDPRKLADWKTFGKAVYNATTAVVTLGMQGGAKMDVGSFKLGINGNPGSFDLIGIRDGKFTPNKNTPTIQSGGEVSLGIFSVSRNTTITDNGSTTTIKESSTGGLGFGKVESETITEIDNSTNEVVDVNTKNEIKVSEIGAKVGFIIGMEIKFDMEKIENAFNKLINE